MKKEIRVTYEEVVRSALPVEVKNLLQLADEAAEKAYAPYSEFRVGAALLLSNGEMLASNNQENMAYPSGLCAERTLSMYARSRYPDADIVQMAIVTLDDEPSDNPVSPCGACRQVLLEYERIQKKPIQLYMSGISSKNVICVEGVETLMPLSFYSKKLSKK